MIDNVSILPTSPIKVVSVSLGSSSRNKSVQTELLGREVHFERIGTDANLNRAISIIKELDGKVQAIGLGGINLYLPSLNKKFPVRQAVKMAKAAKITPVVDGSGLKDAFEPHLIKSLQEQGIINFSNKKVLMVSALDRAAMADYLYYKVNTDIKFGDLPFGLNYPCFISRKNNVKTLNNLANIFLPIVSQLPYTLFYPLGKKQEETISKYAHVFEWAEIIVGDFHYIRRHASKNLRNKIIITSTTTKEDIELLRRRGVEILITTMPNFEGRSFGSNMMEAVIIALAGKNPKEMTKEDYLDYIDKLDWHPNIMYLQEKPQLVKV